MATSMINAMCRCCASEGVFKDVKSTYHWMGDEEIYADMLKECFDVSLFIPEEGAEGGEGGICEVCITQLRNAVNFKKQVLHTEEQFKRHVQNKLFKPNIVKVEVEPDDDNDSDDNNASAEEGYSGAEYEIPIKKEVPEEPKPKKRAAAVKASTSRAKKAKTEIGEPSTKHSTNARDESPPCEDEPQKTITLDRKLNFASFVTIRPVGRNKLRVQRLPKMADKRLTELDWQFDNIRTILKFTNATPMRCKVGSRFACSYCLDQFQTPAELRSHSLENHSYDKPEFYNARSLSRYIVYLDITEFKCNICDENVQGLEDMMDHLKSVHEELIHKNIKNQIVPFKFEGGRVECGVCSENISECEDLQDHMSNHFRNYVCRFCDAGFVIKMKLLEHKKLTHLV